MGAIDSGGVQVTAQVLPDVMQVTHRDLPANVSGKILYQGCQLGYQVTVTDLG